MILPRRTASASTSATPQALSRRVLARKAAVVCALTGALFSACAVAVAIALRVPWAALPLVGLIAASQIFEYRGRLHEIDRAQAREAQLTLYRIAETMAGSEREEDLIRHALDAIAEGIGIPHWAMYLHRGGRGPFALAATRGIPQAVQAGLAPDRPAPDARSPASRVARLGEMEILRLEESSLGWRPPDWIEGLGPNPMVISVPLSDHGDLPAVLQCFLPHGREPTSEQSALLRWMAAQLSSGLKRLRLEQRDQLLASYLLSTGEILLGLDVSGEITQANEAAERELGVPGAALRGTRLDQLAVPDSPPDGASLLDLARSSGEYAGGAWFVRGDGTRFPADVRISAVRDRRGLITAMVLVGRDVTERRTHEEELRLRGDEYARLNRELERAVRSLEGAQRMQNEFLANTSHELRTPLNAVIGFSTLLEQGIDTSEEERREFARLIREAAQHLLGVINDLLDLAKMAAGRFQLQLSLGDLRDVVRGAAEAIEPLAAGKGLRLHLDLPDEPLLAAVDGARVRQVFLNVLGNAVKFTDKGEVRVRGSRDPESGEARLVVEDTGVGIAPELQSRLFSKFVQADHSYHRRHTGTGLGLAISRALVENMGGTISVESEGLNRGTRVMLAFPAPIGSLAAVS
jgi:PAS domain S-box-containing protein